MQETSLFVIVVGPPGSGKGAVQTLITDDIYQLYNQRKLDTNEIHYGLIDSYVELNDTYKIMSNYQYSLPISENDKAKLLSSLYFSIRKNYDAYNDTAIRKAIENKKNIIFETVGAGSIDWIFTTYPELHPSNKTTHGYRIIIVYPYVSNERIVTQARERALKQNMPYRENRFASTRNMVENAISNIIGTNDIGSTEVRDRITNGDLLKQIEGDCLVNNLDPRQLSDFIHEIKGVRLPLFDVNESFSIPNTIPKVQDKLALLINNMCDKYIDMIIIYDNDSNIVEDPESRFGNLYCFLNSAALGSSCVRNSGWIVNRNGIIGEELSSTPRCIASFINKYDNKLTTDLKIALINIAKNDLPDTFTGGLLNYVRSNKHN